MANSDPRAWLARFRKETSMHCYIQNKEAGSLLVLEKTFIFSFPYFKTIEANNIREKADLGTKDMVCRLSLADYLTLLYILNR